MRELARYIAAAALIAAAGCDTLEPSELEPEIVVEAYLVAGERLPNVRLTRTIPLEGSFDAEELGIGDAEVRMELLAADGTVEETYALTPDHRPIGIYRVPNDAVAQPLRSYRLVVDAPGAEELITAVTTVPDTFSTLRANRDTVVYRSDEPFVFHVSPPERVQRQNVFVLTTIALDGHIDDLTPFARAFYEDGDVTVAQLRESVSPLLNEESFEKSDDGSLRIQYPWLAVNFYGRTRVVLQALDDNLYDFIRSQSVQQGGSTLPPGEIPNVLEDVEGARGIFGSVSRAYVEFVVARDLVK